ncbi:hypothetical protein ACFLUT_02035 [Chloroflexota bacterium]
MKAHSPTCGVLWMVRRAIQLLPTEGLGGLATGLAQYLQYRRFWSTRFVIYTTNTSSYEAGLAVPPVEGLELHILHSESDMDRLVATGYEDARGVVGPARRRLRKGAVGFCTFVKGVAAHVSWVALSESAKHSLEIVPSDVRFDDGEGYWGESITMRRFRNLGICEYVMALRLRHCHERGYAVLIDATAVDNVTSFRGQDIYAPRVRCLSIPTHPVVVGLDGVVERRRMIVLLTRGSWGQHTSGGGT